MWRVVKVLFLLVQEEVALRIKHLECWHEMRSAQATLVGGMLHKFWEVWARTISDAWVHVLSGYCIKFRKIPETRLRQPNCQETKRQLRS
ncbi:hypothetical protein FKM82_006012 [Ascaphus truei]